MAKARHSSLDILQATGVPKARHSTVNIRALTGSPKAQHSTVKVSSTSTIPRARHSSLTAFPGSTVVTKWIKTSSGLQPLSRNTEVAPPPPPAAGGWRFGSLGTYKPLAATSGVDPAQPLVRLDGDQIITVANTVIENRDVYGMIQIQAANVTIRNCILRGPVNPPTGSTIVAVVRCEHPGVSNALIEDCTLIPQTPDGHIDGVRGHHYTVRRCDISRICDGFGVMNSSNWAGDHNVHIEANYVHDHAYLPDSNQSDAHTHNDGAQLFGGSNIWLVGNYFKSMTDPTVPGSLVNPYASTGYQVTGQSNLLGPTVANLSNVHLLDNYYDYGGEANIHMVVNTGAGWTTSQVEVLRNKFGRNQRTIGGVKYTIRKQAAVTAVTLGSGADANIFEDTGLPVTVVTY